jgi:hypothetical protein
MNARDATAAPALDTQLDRLERMCPAWLCKIIHLLREPRLRVIRLTAGVLMIIGGLLSFLPILGIELLPIGIVLIAIDVPFLRGPAARMLSWLEYGIVWAIGLWQAIRVRARRAAARWRMIPKRPASGLMRSGYRFSDNPAPGSTRGIMRK